MTAHSRHQSDTALKEFGRTSNVQSGAPVVVSSTGIGPFAPACPRCSGQLTRDDQDVLICAADQETYRKVDGVWRFLLPERDAYFQPFLADYQAIRRAEGRGSSNPAYYRSLPNRDLTGRFTEDWRIRSRSYEALVNRVIIPRERDRRAPLKILDLGAGNCWLSNRLAERGHQVAAVDLLDNEYDGLGCYQHYDHEFAPVHAEFARLPFASNQFDLAIFNGAIHYATDYDQVITEALRVLVPDGEIVIMDSPLYQDESSGVQMIREREAQFERDYGFPSSNLSSEGFLSYRRLSELSATLGVDWQFHRVWYGPEWAVRPLKARLLGRREPARFLLITGRRSVPKSQSGSEVSIATKSLRKLSRSALRVRYLLTQRHRHRRLTFEHAAGISLVVLPDVFNPVLFKTGAYLAETLGEDLVRPGASVLELGTGTGIGAIAAGRWASRVVAVDINPSAVRCAKINALLNGVEDRVNVRQGDLFEALGDTSEKFDVALFNPPYFRGTPADSYDHAWRSLDVVERFASGLGDFLSPDGVAYIVLSSDGDSERFLESFKQNGYTVGVVTRRTYINETLTIYRIQLNGEKRDVDPV